MKITNKANLPEGIVNTIKNDSYSKGDADYSASQLSTPPQIMQLMRLNGDKIEVDVADEIWKLLGSAVHYILERGQEGGDPLENELHDLQGKINALKIILQRDGADAEEINYALESELFDEPKKPQKSFVETENRLYGKLAGIKISGQPDWLDRLVESLDDYKVTSVWKVLKKDYEDWTAQLNIYRWLAEENNTSVNRLRIIAILKDWKKHEKGRTTDYPDIPVAVIPIEIWNPIQTTQYILDRIRVHEEAKQITDPDELADKFPCSEKDKWSKPNVYKVKKIDGSRAVNGGVFKVEDYDNEDQAQEAAKQFMVEKGADHTIEKVEGEDTRCLEYCLVKDFCSQYKRKYNNQSADIDEGNDSTFLNIIDKFEDEKEETKLPEEKEETVNERFERQQKAIQEKTLTHQQEEEKSSEQKKDESIDDLLNEFNLDQ